MFGTLLHFQGKRNTIQERIIALAILIGVFTGMVPALAINTETNQVTTTVLSTTDDGLPEVTAPSSDYPVAEDRTPKRTLTVVATAYNSLKGQTDSTPCTPAMPKFNLCDFYEEHGFGNTIASNYLPLGTHVRFPDLFGDKVFVVRDRMNARYGSSRVDVWFHDYAEARKFGAKRTKLEIF